MNIAALAIIAAIVVFIMIVIDWLTVLITIGLIIYYRVLVVKKNKSQLVGLNLEMYNIMNGAITNGLKVIDSIVNSLS